MTDYPSKFDPAKRYSKTLFAPERHVHTHDLNDLQDILGHRVKRGLDALISDGDLLAGGALRVNAETGATSIGSGTVYANGQPHDVPAATMTIPVDRTVEIGICVVEDVVTYLQDASLKGSVPGTRAYGEPGADRRRVTATWTWSGAGTCQGTFYGVYTVVDGNVLTQAPPPILDPVNDALARYDRENNGHYIVNGWRVFARGYSAPEQSQSFSIEEGTVNVFGYKIDRLTAYPLKVVEDPDLEEIEAEPHVVPANPANPLRIYLNKGPVAEILGVTVLKQVSQVITHGPYSGISDPLAHTSVAEVVSVTQGGTTYVAGVSFVLTADQINWSPGGPEPAPGSTYTVVYRYLDVTPPDSSDSSSIVVSDATAGSTVLVRYRWKLPRVDLVTVDRRGLIGYVRGKSSRYAPLAPPVPNDVFALAEVTNVWGGTPTVVNTNTRTVHTNRLQQFGNLIDDLFDLVAQERLKRDIDRREVVAKRGLAVDPFRNDDLRDAGIAQTAAIVDGTLQLPIALTSESRLLQATPYLLPYTEEVITEQALVTGCMKINPYQAFGPTPPTLALNPAVDHWTVTDQQWESDETREIRRWRDGGTHRERSVLGRETTVTTTVSSARTDDTKLRSQAVAFTITGFGAGERLEQLTFDGVDLTPVPKLVANGAGVVTGTFTIPAGLPSGTKAVLATGGSGAVARATYSGTGVIETTVLRRIFTTTIWFEADPLAETCTLDATRQVTSVDVKFCAIGDRDNDVFLQVREVQYGVPTDTIVAEGRLSMAAVQTGQWTTLPLLSPVNRVAGVEYALVLLTNDPDHAVSIAELGTFDAERQRWVTAQPYTIGVLLSSSNVSTWTPHQTQDLTFRQKAARFTATTRTIDAGNWNLVNCSDLVVLAGVELPTTECSVQVLITRANGSTILVYPGQLVEFAEYVTETVNIKFLLSGTDVHSPVLFPLVQVLKGQLAAAGSYASRAMVAGADARVLVTVETLLPNTSALAVKVGQTQGAAAAVALASAAPLGDGWQERTYVLAPYALTDARVFLALSGSPAARPQVRNLRALVTDIPPNITGG